MNYLLDVNILVAWAWQDHADHLRTARWIATVSGNRRNQLLTSAIPELGFVRVSVHRGQGQITAQDAAQVLNGMIKVLGTRHQFLPDDQPSRAFPDWCQGAARTTDAHLLALAKSHRAELATLDQSIPGAFLIPLVP